MQTKCFTRARVPEYYALLPAIHGRGTLWLMFLYSSLNSPNDPVAGVAFGPSGTAAIGCGKSYLAGKATTFSPLGSSGGDFNLKLRRKELHL
jgi:hypothetical protein